MERRAGAVVARRGGGGKVVGTTIPLGVKGKPTDSVRAFVEHSPEALDAVTAACGQLQVACDTVRARPSAARPMTSLRLAEETLANARTRLNAELPAKPELLAGLAVSVLGEELAAADSTLGFARRQFNEATQNYNDALDQFPTWVIAGLFRFRGAGTL